MTMNSLRYRLADPKDVPGKTDRQILQAIVDGELPQAPISKTMSSRVVAQGRQIISAEARRAGPDGKTLPHGTSTILVLAAGS